MFWDRVSGVYDLFGIMKSGQMYLASLPPHRAKMGNFILYAEKQLKDLGVEIHLIDILSRVIHKYR